MRFMKAAFVLLALLYLCGGIARAQSTTGTIRAGGRRAGAPAARRDRECRIAEPAGHPHGVTSENGDYILTLLPSGTYTSRSS